jgi:hypothetical protein
MFIDKLTKPNVSNMIVGSASSAAFEESVVVAMWL